MSPQLPTEPSEFFEFVHLHGFDRAFDQFHLDDDDLTALQMAILSNPKGPPIIRGTGEIRKTRFAPLKENRGKSGGYRVCFAVFEEISVIVLILIYRKSEQDDLTDGERDVLKELYHRIKEAYSK